MDIAQIIQGVKQGDKRSLAKAITIVENDLNGSQEILSSIKSTKNPIVVGITGPPGAGKSSLINALLNELSSKNKSLGIIAVDPTSPFSNGSLLGDRHRMNEHFLNTNIFIRSIATRGTLGGLSAKAYEIIDLMKASDFDYIFVETVGVGQSEVEVMKVVDIVILVLVPESGDEVQTLKSGIMEIANIFVVNKCDREGADRLIKSIQENTQAKNSSVLKTIATKNEGIKELIKAMDSLPFKKSDEDTDALTQKAYHLILKELEKKLDKTHLKKILEAAKKNKEFNIYSFAKKYAHEQAKL